MMKTSNMNPKGIVITFNFAKCGTMSTKVSNYPLSLKSATGVKLVKIAEESAFILLKNCY